MAKIINLDKVTQTKNGTVVSGSKPQNVKNGKALKIENPGQQRGSIPITGIVVPIESK